MILAEWSLVMRIKVLYSGMSSEEGWVFLFTLICSLTFMPLSNDMITLKFCVALSLQKRLILSFLISVVIKLLVLMALTILLSRNVGPSLEVTCISCALISFIIGLTLKASIILALPWSPRKIILRK
jgi:hypothetical protein